MHIKGQILINDLQEFRLGFLIFFCQGESNNFLKILCRFRDDKCE